MDMSTYGLYFQELPEHILKVNTIGWESISSPAYRWDGTERTDKGFLFQYTLSGEGKLLVGKNSYTVRRNQGFFVTIPGRHLYHYDPDSSEPWEFIYIMLGGSDTYNYWARFIADFDTVVTLKPDSEPIQLLWKLYRDIGSKALSDKYAVTSKAYEWMFSMMRYADSPQTIHTSPDQVNQAKQFIERYFNRRIGLPEIAAELGVSTSRLCRIFHDHTGETPIRYLQKKRIESAAYQLRHTPMPIEEIAVGNGFDNASYFGKVFRAYTGMTPRQFRTGKQEMPVNQLLLY